MKILILGGFGFVGSRLNFFLKKKNRVIQASRRNGLDLFNLKNAFYSKSSRFSKIKYHNIDYYYYSNKTVMQTAKTNHIKGYSYSSNNSNNNNSSNNNISYRC